MLGDHADNIAGMQARIEELRGEGQTVMHLVIDGRFAGLIGVADRIKDTTPKPFACSTRPGCGSSC